MTLINILDNEFLDEPPVVIDRVRFIIYIADETRFQLQVDEQCVTIDNQFDLEI